MIRWIGAREAAEDTGPVGPVAVFALLLLVAASPLMRGGNRHVALIVLEGIALAFLTAFVAGASGSGRGVSRRTLLLVFLLASPAWLALVYLLPVPQALWAATPGRGEYTGALSAAGIQSSGWLPLSLVPDATAASLFAGIPIVAAFLAGYRMRLPQLHLVLKVFVVTAFLEVVMGLLQVAGGAGSSLYFGGIGGRPFGTFANPNHFANYVAMGLVAYVVLAWTNLAHGRQHAYFEHHASAHARRVALWAAGGVLLAAGILLSRSRGAMLAGLPAGLCALALSVTATTRARAWRTALIMVGIAVVLALSLVGFEFVLSRFELRSFGGDASFRTLIASSSLDGAWQFWPLGAGWGTYGYVYPRFQSADVVGTVTHAHHDYAEFLFEGGIFAVLLMAAFAWLAGSRALQLAWAGLRRGRLRRAEMLSALCGLGLLGFLLHSLVEFNMHIPANAIMAALLAGVYLRPLDGEDPAGD